MQKSFVFRDLQPHIEKRLHHNPAVVLLGARQVGKSTLAKHILKKYKHFIYLDLEKLSDRQKMTFPPIICP